MKYSIITITREFGSGGRTIGKKLAEDMNLMIYLGYMMLTLNY